MPVDEIAIPGFENLEGVELVQKLPLFRTLTFEETRRLFAIAQSGVEDDQSVGHVSVSSLGSPVSSKPGRDAPARLPQPGHGDPVAALAPAAGPEGLDPGLAGLEIHFAYLLAPAPLWDFASNAIELTVVP